MIFLISLAVNRAFLIRLPLKIGVTNRLNRLSLTTISEIKKIIRISGSDIIP